MNVKLLCCQGGYFGSGCRGQENCTGPIDPNDPFRQDLQREGIEEICEIGRDESCKNQSPISKSL